MNQQIVFVVIPDGATLRGCTDEMDQGVREKCNNTLDCATCRDFDGNSGCNQQVSVCNDD